MKSISKLNLFSRIWGILVTLFMLLSVGSYIVVGIIEDSRKFFNQLSESFSNKADPTLYFFCYIIGYLVIWWKPLWGSIIIITASIYYVIVAGLQGPPIFAIPGFIVGALYLINWFIIRAKQTNKV